MTRTIRMMCSGGDMTIAEWDTSTVTPERLKEIEHEFKTKMDQGWFAADIGEGRNTLIKEFDPQTDILLIPRMMGGL